jgi:hypothetical protein
MIALVRDELNVLEVELKPGEEEKVTLDLALTGELKDMGEAREIIRSIQAERKKLGCSLDARVVVTLPDWPDSQTEEIKRQTLANDLINGEALKVEVV